MNIKEELSLMPQGWWKAFGEMMYEEIQREIDKSNLDLIILECKEKFGQLRVYYANGNKKIDDIIERYAIISQHVCINCGKPDVYVLNFDWIEPMCKECYEKCINDTRPYDKVVCKDAGMLLKNSYTIRTLDGDEWITKKIDISETSNEVRKRWLDANLS